MALDVTTVITNLYPSLNATGSGDLVFWTLTELYQWADEAAKRLARAAAVFIERDTSISLVSLTASYTLPSRHLSVIYVAVNGVGLNAANVRELQALSDTWEGDACLTGETPARWATDFAGLETILLHPAPFDIANLQIVQHVFPVEITASAHTLEAPLVVGDYLACRMLAEARRKESDAQMPEIAAAFDQRSSLYEKAFQAYFGGVL